MPRITAIALHAVDLPFHVAFHHSAAVQRTSDSLFLELHLDDGSVGWGEALPRYYVTGETRHSACELLHTMILPRLLGQAFGEFADVVAFLTECDGRAPAEWAPRQAPQLAAWCAVDLALLDAFGQSFGCRLPGVGDAASPPAFRYSGVISAGHGWNQAAQLLWYRWQRFAAIKVKITASTSSAEIARIRRLAGVATSLRVDVNMGWSFEQANAQMPVLVNHGIRSFEQPLAAGDLDGMARLLQSTGCDVVADESFHTRDSLCRLIDHHACTAINARISKCGGWMATIARCHEAHAAGLAIQVGCHVGESSLLSAANLQLCQSLPVIRHAEGCFGRLLLDADPGSPLLQMGRSGAPPDVPLRPTGIGVTIDRQCIEHHRSRDFHHPPRQPGRLPTTGCSARKPPSHPTRR